MIQKVVIAPDSFKGSLSARQVADIIADAIVADCPNCAVVRLPLADGGEGSLETIISSVGGTVEETRVLSADGRQITASFGITTDGQAILELAQSSGITRQIGLHPLTANTYGFGQLILHALDLGLRNFFLCIGGSASTDGGCAMASALGVAFLDAEKTRFVPSGATLKHIADIDISGMDKRVLESSFTVLCDVDNPLYGPNGAALVYGPQKGASPSEARSLDNGLRHLSEKLLQASGSGIDSAHAPCAGAAGGLGFGCMAMLNARPTSGINALLELCNFTEHLKDADLIITGEGKLDEQSFSGKVLSGILLDAGEVPVVSICGICECTESQLRRHGLTVFETSRGIPLEESLANPQKYLMLAAAKAVHACLAP